MEHCQTSSIQASLSA